MLLRTCRRWRRTVLRTSCRGAPRRHPPYAVRRNTTNRRLPPLRNPPPLPQHPLLFLLRLLLLQLLVPWLQLVPAVVVVLQMGLLLPGLWP